VYVFVCQFGKQVRVLCGTESQVKFFELRVDCDVRRAACVAAKEQKACVIGCQQVCMGVES
jgi:hypothetical protein